MRLLPGILLLILCCFSRKPAVRHRFLVLFGGILYAKTRTNSNEEIHEKKNDFLDFFALCFLLMLCPLTGAQKVWAGNSVITDFSRIFYIPAGAVLRGEAWRS